MLEISNLYRRFGDKEVLKGLNLNVPEHSIFGFIGKNGAGKTTTMKLVLGLLKADDPDITLSAQERPIGGLGIYMVKQSMDEISYEYRNEQNILTIKKHI